MKGQIKRLLAILFVVFFIATSTASAYSADDGYDYFCGNGIPIFPDGPWWHYGPLVFKDLTAPLNNGVLNGNIASSAMKC